MLKPVVFLFLSLVCVSFLHVPSTQASVRVRRRSPRRCSYIPAEGCTCHSRFGRLTISCVNLGLTEVPDLGVIPDGSIVQLDLSSNQISDILPDAFDGIRLQKLVIKNNYATDTIRMNINCFRSQAQHLLYVDLSHSGISSSIPSAFDKAANLKILTLIDNSITGLDPGLPWRKLKHLYLEDNPIFAAKRAFYKLKKLRYLSMSMLSIITADMNLLEEFLPCDDLAKLTSLKIVDTDVEYQLRNVIKRSCLSKLTQLVCNNCNLSDPCVDFLKPSTGRNLLSISLSNNHLGDAAIRKLIQAPSIK